jgi:sugar phosphate isomerase/epimerase
VKIEYFCPLWGSSEIPFNDFITRVINAGYNGVEMSFPSGTASDRDSKAAALRTAGLKLIAQHWETENPDPKTHPDEYEARLRHAAGAAPDFISSQTGRDFFPFEDNLKILAVAEKVSEETGVKIVHETHRSKLTFAAHITQKFLEKLPQMRLTLDVSHWFCVHERYLADQEEALALAISRTDHIHARVGHDQGSQVTDFRKREWIDVLKEHLAVWDRIVETARAEGRERLTVTPEFGPSPYMLFHPGTSRPLADQWKLNTDMMALLRKRWS